MAPRIDPVGRTLTLAVADLLDSQLLRSLGFSQRGGYERMWLGQAIHSRYQEEALGDDATYRREVRLEARFEHRGWTVVVQGRADGLRREEDGRVVVEEIKSIRRGGALSPAMREVYERQAALYAWMLATVGETPADRIAAELVLIEIGSDRVERQPVEVHLRAIEATVRRRVVTVLRAHREEEEARQRRRQAGEALPFPYPEERRGQQPIREAVARALDQGEHVLVAAPTGIGKTVAALHPALSFALREGKRVFVLTAKTLQQEMATQVLQLLNRDKAFHALRLKAKAKMCANDQVLCHEEYCPYARDYYLKLQESRLVERLLGELSTLLPESIYGAAKHTQVCPFEVSLELAGHAQVTVCDYNYAFDPYVKLSDFGEDADLSNTVLVIDEIHNLVDRGRRYYSPVLTTTAARRAGEEVAHGGAPIHREIARLCGDLERLIEETVADAIPPGAGATYAVEQALPEDELWRLRPRLDRAFVDYLEYRRDTKTLVADDRFVELYFDVLKFLNALVVSDAAFSHMVERQELRELGMPTSEGRLRILCKDPSRFLGAVIERCHTVIGLSATLSPHEFYRDLLGFDAARTAALELDNPFPPAHRAVVVDSTVATTWRERPANYPRIAERLGAFADAVPGNTLALFPSYHFLAEVAGKLRCREKRVLVQQRSDDDLQRQEILETLRTAIFGDVLLLAVAGGVFAEGVDYPGEMLKAVAVVGPCLPGLSLDQELLQRYYDERFDRGFEYAFVVPGMTRVVQAAGRLIRSPDDTGVIALFDRRFLQGVYRRHLPADWVPEGGHRRLVGDPDAVARDFFAALRVAETA